MKFLPLTRQFAIYFIVGFGATVVEWSVFFFFDNCLRIHYTLSTVAAFCVSTFANWGLGRILLFKKSNPKGLLFELLCIYAISVVGLAANLLIMWACIEKLRISDMVAKIVATGIVFVGNFAIRKFWIYKSDK